MTPTERRSLDGHTAVAETMTQGITNASSQYHRIDGRVEVCFYAVGRHISINLTPPQWATVIDMIRTTIKQTGGKI